MNRKQINKIINETKKRSTKIKVFIFLIIISMIIGTSLIYISLNEENNYYLHYDESSDLDYKVYLKDNDYFGEYLGKGNQYIASLIDYIEADFKYKLSIVENVDFSYYYYVESTLEVLDNNDKKLYEKVDTILPKETISDVSNNSFEVNKKVKLDYNYYNAIASGFIKRYNLTGVKSTITLKLHVGVKGNCEEFNSDLLDDSVISMSIPLTTNTVNIDMNYVLNNGTDKLIECSDADYININLLVIGISSLVLMIGLTIYIIIYSRKTRNGYTEYIKRLKNIFNNYGQYISKIKTELKYNKFQIVLVEEFEDLFEVRNSSFSPILFSQDQSKTKSAFMVPTNSGLVYVYYYSLENALKGEDIYEE